MLALLWKEWRQIRGLFGMLLALVPLWVLARADDTIGRVIVDDLNGWYMLLAIGGAVLLGVDALAGERGGRTLDFWAARPVSTWRWVGVKYALGIAALSLYIGLLVGSFYFNWPADEPWELQRLMVFERYAFWRIWFQALMPIWMFYTYVFLASALVDNPFKALAVGPVVAYLVSPLLGWVTWVPGGEVLFSVSTPFNYRGAGWRSMENAWMLLLRLAIFGGLFYAAAMGVAWMIKRRVHFALNYWMVGLACGGLMVLVFLAKEFVADDGVEAPTAMLELQGIGRDLLEVEGRLYAATSHKVFEVEGDGDALRRGAVWENHPWEIKRLATVEGQLVALGGRPLKGGRLEPGERDGEKTPPRRTGPEDRMMPTGTPRRGEQALAFLGEGEDGTISLERSLILGHEADYAWIGPAVSRGDVLYFAASDQKTLWLEAVDTVEGVRLGRLEIHHVPEVKGLVVGESYSTAVARSLSLHQSKLTCSLLRHGDYLYIGGPDDLDVVHLGTDGRMRLATRVPLNDYMGSDYNARRPLALDGGRLYVMRYWPRELTVFDVSDPGDPVEAEFVLWEEVPKRLLVHEGRIYMRRSQIEVHRLGGLAWGRVRAAELEERVGLDKHGGWNDARLVARNGRVYTLMNDKLVGVAAGAAL